MDKYIFNFRKLVYFLFPLIVFMSPDLKAQNCSLAQLESYDIKFYRFDLEASNDSREIAGWAEVHAHTLENNIDTLVLQLNTSMNVDSVLVDAFLHTFIHADQLLKVPVDISPGQDFVAKIYYHGTPSGTFFKGIHNQHSSIYNQWVTYTFSQPFYACKWFPCKQLHNDKIDSVYMTLRIDSTLTAVSSGILHAKSALENGKVMYEWRTKYAINYDMIFFAVSDYILYDYYAHPAGYADSVYITHFVYNQDYLDDYQDRLDSIGLFVEYFSSIYGLYPFADEGFGLVVVPGIPSMTENNTMVVMIEELDLGYTHTFIDGNCHELTHQWFGDYVACHTFADIWLSEGFGMYGGYLGEQHFGISGSAESWLEKTRAQALTQFCGSVHVPENQLNNASRIFDWQLTYCKGSLLVHMIRYTLHDDELFFSVLQNYINEYANGTSVLDDFKSVLEQTTGLDFTTFFDQWYYGEGYPILDISWVQIGDTLHIYSDESTTCDTTPFFKLTMDYQLIYEEGDTVIRLSQDKPIEHFILAQEKDVIDIIPDPDHWILAETNVGHVGLTQADDPVPAIVLYPNPAHGKFQITSAKFQINAKIKKINVQIVDLYGKLVEVFEMEHGTRNMEHDISYLPAGLYLVRITNGTSINTQKLIIY